MEVHVMLLSTMNPEMTRDFLSLYDLEFDATPGTICKLHWPIDLPVSVSLWVACQHPIVDHLSASFLPHMDACVCLYHDHDGLSCVKVGTGIELLQKYHSNVWMMATTIPEVIKKHSSRVRLYYNENGFEITRLTKDLNTNLEAILKVHIEIQKTL